MGKSPAFQLYASDFYMDTVGWTPTQIGIYFRLLMSEWVNGSIPEDTEKLARIAQIGHGNFLKCYRPTIEGKFTQNGNENLINKRLEEEREKQQEFLKSQSKSGLRGIEAKKRKGIFPFNKSTDPLSNPSTDPASENQALQFSSSLKENIIKEKTSYGEFQNVKLTDSEYKKLSSLFGPEQCNERIESLSQYIASKGKKYSSHYATILSWERKNKNKDPKSW